MPMPAPHFLIYIVMPRTRPTERGLISDKSQKEKRTKEKKKKKKKPVPYVTRTGSILQPSYSTIYPMFLCL